MNRPLSRFSSEYGISKSSKSRVCWHKPHKREKICKHHNCHLKALPIYGAQLHLFTLWVWIVQKHYILEVQLQTCPASEELAHLCELWICLLRLDSRCSNFRTMGKTKDPIFFDSCRTVEFDLLCTQCASCHTLIKPPWLCKILHMSSCPYSFAFANGCIKPNSTL